MSSLPRVRCRQIALCDLEAVADVLTCGFPDRPRKYWTNALEVLKARETLPGCPKFGFLLEAEGRVVGVHLLIFSRQGDGSIRCNTSSWCVEPAYRFNAAILASVATRLKHVTYVNTSAATHTWPILRAMGYQRYSQGQFVAVPALRLGAGARVSPFADSPEHRALPEYEMMRAHAATGCLAVVCDSAQGLSPFIFVRRKIAYAPIGVMQLVYCRETADFVACAGPLGRFLLTRRASCVICDADAPIAGLIGLFFRNKTPRFFKGAVQPRQNDLAFTEMVLFGP